MQSGRILHERDQAQRERDKAQQVATFLEEIFEASDPGAAQGETMTARALLDRAADRIDTVDVPSEIQVALMTTMGRIYRELGVYARARHLLEKALDTRLGVLGRDHLEVAESLSELGELSLKQGDHEQAEEFFQESLGLQFRRRRSRDHLYEAWGKPGKTSEYRAILTALDRVSEAQP